MSTPTDRPSVGLSEKKFLSLGKGDSSLLKYKLNTEKAKIHWRNVKIFFSRTT